MIGFKNAGRMGNYLFQAANCIAVALRNSVEFSMPNFTSHQFYSPLYLQHLVNPKYIQGKVDIAIQEPHFHYAPIEYKKEWDDKQVVLFGYFQSYKYIEDFRNEILDLFNYRWELKKGFISVHIRRGDYVELRNKHPEITVEWYEQAMGRFPKHKFIFYSDDIKFCQDNFGHRNDCFFEHIGIEQDLINAASCEHNICSPSTYSFFIYWLNRNKDKIGIFPEKWFTDGWDGAYTRDILPPEVIKL